MIFHPTEIEGVLVVELEPVEDGRGFFARSWCSDEFARRGLEAGVRQSSISFNKARGTLRGLHYQAAPAEETKLVRVTRGSVFDVAVDLRPGSKTYCSWTSAELSAENRLALYIPPGCAHGFQTLEDGAEVFYTISSPYRPELSRGVRWDDPAFAIRWPDVERRILSDRDRGYPDFVP